MEWMLIGVAVFVVMRLVGGRGCGWYGRGYIPRRALERRSRRWARRGRDWVGSGDGDYGRREALEAAADRLEAASERLRARARAGGNGELARGADASDGERSLESRNNGNGTRPSRAEPVKRKETPLEELQRRFADGRISMEQYERELDELLGLGA